jgi:hypothetical protein
VEIFNPEHPFGGVQISKESSRPVQVEINTGSPVQSVFGRAGNVTALQGDYAAFYAPKAAGVPLDGSVGMVLAKKSSVDYDLEWKAIASAPVLSVFGRTGDIFAAQDDYSFAQLSGKPTTLAGYGIIDPVVLTSGSYANPAWITSLAWAKITGAPAFITANQTITLTGEVTGSGATSIATIIAAATRANWDTAYTDRLKWDGGSTGLVAATGRASLGLVIGTNVEGYLGNPSTDGYLLASTVSGTRSWVAPPAGGAGAVSSVFGRTGAVVAANGDYNFSQLTGAASPTQAGLPTGGAVGDRLKKNSATNYDSVWTPNLAETWTYATAAARTGATGFVAGDVGKIAYQTDDGTYWRLIATTPTWQPLWRDDSASTDEYECLRALGSPIVGKPPGMSIFMGGDLSSSAPGNMAAYFVPVWVPRAATITGVHWFQVVAGNYVAVAGGGNHVGLYTFSGSTLTQVALSATDGNIWKLAANNFGTKAFQSPYNASRGLYYVGFILNATSITTAPTLALSLWTPIGSGWGNFTLHKFVPYMASQNNLPATVDMDLAGIASGLWFFSLY